VAVIGGFHLSGPMFEPIIPPTVQAFDELTPTFLMPAHCTGWKAIQQLAARLSGRLRGERGRDPSLSSSG
jgi:7,8-dihydropterin-6-yl-methyl-4-(beta-D-ribofuranosyl)aminobenzene 5'-phosphate synthase